MNIDIVPQELCPRCGGGEEFANRPKIGHEDGSWSWKCYNPDCNLGFWNPTTGEQENVLAPEDRAAHEARVAERLKNITFIKVVIQ